MFRVEWLQAALMQLTTAWTQADSALRQAITAAARKSIRSFRRTPTTQANRAPEGDELCSPHRWASFSEPIPLIGQ
jgi:hypothetical protein